MTFWTENYSFIREVYDTRWITIWDNICHFFNLFRYQKMVEWMDNVEMAIQKVCASKVYTSAEFKREKDNFHVCFFRSWQFLKIDILVTLQKFGKSWNQEMVDWDSWDIDEGFILILSVSPKNIIIYRKEHQMSKKRSIRSLNWSWRGTRHLSPKFKKHS